MWEPLYIRGERIFKNNIQHPLSMQVNRNPCRRLFNTICFLRNAWDTCCNEYQKPSIVFHRLNTTLLCGGDWDSKIAYQTTQHASNLICFLRNAWDTCCNEYKKNLGSYNVRYSHPIQNFYQPSNNKEGNKTEKNVTPIFREPCHMPSNSQMKW